MDIKKLRAWLGITQIEMAKRLSIKQGTLSDVENAKRTASSSLIDRVTEIFTPKVLFISHSQHTPILVSAMLKVGQVDVVVDALHEACSTHFYEAMKTSQTIAVITDDKEPFTTLIAKAIEESGLPFIPTRGIMIGEEGDVEMWND